MLAHCFGGHVIALEPQIAETVSAILFPILMRSLLRFFAPLALCFLAFSALPQHLSAAAETGIITVEQQSPNGIIGEWVLIKPENKRLSLHKETHTINDAPLGNYTLLVEPPAGAETTVRMFLEQDLLDSFEQPQISFTLEQNMHIRLRIEYAFIRVGVVGVNSQPPGMEYTLSGPNDFEVSDTTPQSYRDMPEGQYTLNFKKIPDCPVPKAISDKLQADGRVNFSITFDCEGLKNLDQQKEFEKSFQFVSTEIEGEQITFTDTPLEQWFAPYVNKALKTGIMSGYRDDNGNLSGKFGPGDNVTIAQLSKVAHELADIDERKVRKTPTNVRARDVWFEQYFASAEELDWLVFADHRIDPGRPATRGEVVVTLLQALNIPRLWAQGEMFTDVRRSTDYSSSIETAATDGVVSGFTDANDNPTGEFGPDRPVNRAEISKIISETIDIYIEGAE